MPGLAFHLQTLKAVNPPALASEPQAAALGALGPDVFRFLPPSPALVAGLGSGGVLSGSNLALLQQAVANPSSLTSQQLATLSGLAPTMAPLLLELWAKPIGATYSLLLGPAGLDVATMWPLLNQVTSLLTKLEGIVHDKDEIALAEQLSHVESIGRSASKLASISSNLQALMQQVGFLPALGPWMQEPMLGSLERLDPALAGLPSQDDVAGCRLYEFLRWHRTGEFATSLTRLASTPSQRAFAQGWRCHLAASVTAEPFIENIVGGPYRTHWWRNMLVQNFVDAWIFGFAETPGASMAGDTPSPAYASWADLCSANLQEEFNIAGALTVPAATTGVPAAVTALISGDLTPILGTLPVELDEISQLFDKALAASYPAAELPKLGASALPAVGASFAPNVLKSAYIGAFAVYWFLTSGTGPFGNNQLGAPPGNCGTSPPPFISSGSSPSPAQVGLNTPGAVCALLFAILAALSLLGGDLLGGATSLAIALAAPAVNWDVVACNLFWERKLLLSAENALRDLLVYFGLGYPPPILLGGEDVDGNIEPATDLTPDPNLQQLPASPTGNIAPTLGVPLTRSNLLRTDPSACPAGLDQTLQGRADLDWLVYPLPPQTPAAGGMLPAVPTETPATEALIGPMLYPNAVFDSPLANGGMMEAGGGYPSANQFLGGAVANAEQVVAAIKAIPQFNLDGDRGYGWLSWHPAAASDPTTPPVQDEQDG